MSKGMRVEISITDTDLFESVLNELVKMLSNEDIDRDIRQGYIDNLISAGVLDDFYTGGVLDLDE